MPIPTSVYAEMTPNPEVMKFVADRDLLPGGHQVEFRSAQEAAVCSPLASELFHFPFVTSVFISGPFVSVTKESALGWEMIVQQLREYIREWLMEHAVAVDVEALEAAQASGMLVPGAGSEGVVAAGQTAPHPAFIADADIVPSPFDDAIRHLLDEFVRPAVEQDGGAIDFKAFKDGTVYVHMRGACSGCPSSMQTLKGGIEQLLTAKIPEVREVVAS
jgi:Fe-S cluster biogenesis protein NfuA